MILQNKYARARARLDPAHAPLPRALYISVNSVCNANCFMCDKGDTLREGQMPLEGFYRLMQEVSKWRPAVFINATEPLMHAGVDLMVANARAMGMSISLTTNGILLPDCVQVLAEAGLSRLWVSIDGVGNLHDEIRGVNGCYQRAVRGAEMALRAGIPVGVAYCINEKNYGNLVETAKEMKKLGVRDMVFQHLSYRGDEPREVDTATLRKQLDELRNEGYEERNFLPNLVTLSGLNTWYLRPNRQLGNGECRIAWNSTQVLSNGDVIAGYRCALSPVMGNVFKEGLEKVWRGKEYRTFRRFIKEKGAMPECYRCCSLYGG